MNVNAAGVEMRCVSKAYGAVLALKGFSLVVPPGRIVGLLGPNGAGKTTALRILAGLLPRDSGEVYVWGVDPALHPQQVRRRVGYLTGDTGLYERLTPSELLAYFGDLFGLAKSVSRERAKQLIERLHIEPFARRPCGQLSTGQRQRVSIARALLHDPDVLIMDEPTSGLDVLAAQFVLKAMQEERARGKSVLYCSHALAEAELICDEVALLHQGRVVAEGSVPSVIAKHGGSTLTAALLQAIAEVDSEARNEVIAMNRPPHEPPRESPYEPAT